MDKCITVAVVATGLLIAALAHSQEVDVDRNWITDPSNSCRVFNPEPASNESIKWSGECSNGKANGQGVLEWYIDGNLLSRYEGKLVNGVRAGKGVLTTKKGLRYEGDFVDNKWTGNGTLVLPSGDRYEGDWLNNKQHGNGKLTLANGQVRVGIFDNGKFVAGKASNGGTPPKIVSSGIIPSGSLLSPISPTIDISPSGRFAITKWLEVFDIKTGKPIKTLKIDASGWANDRSDANGHSLVLKAKFLSDDLVLILYELQTERNNSKGKGVWKLLAYDLTKGKVVDEIENVWDFNVTPRAGKAVLLIVKGVEGRYNSHYMHFAEYSIASGIRAITASGQMGRDTWPEISDPWRCPNMDMSQDGKSIAVIYKNENDAKNTYSLAIHDVSTGQPTIKKTSGNRMWCPKFLNHSDGELRVATNDGGIANADYVSPGGKWIVDDSVKIPGSHEYGFVVFNAKTLEKRTFTFPYCVNGLAGVAFSDDERIISVGAIKNKDCFEDHQQTRHPLWDLETGKELLSSSDKAQRAKLFKAGAARYDSWAKAERDRENRNSGGSGAAYDPTAHCASSDTCFQVKETKGSNTAIICTKGLRRGQSAEICGPDKKGRWASGCGLTQAFAYHYTYREAGNIACGN